MRRTAGFLAAALLAAPAGAFLFDFPTSSPKVDDSFGYPSTAECMCGTRCLTSGNVAGICQEDGTCQVDYGGQEYMAADYGADRPLCPRPACLTATTDVERMDVDPTLWVAKVSVMIDYLRNTVLITIKGPASGFFAAGFNGERMAGTYAVVCANERDGGRSPHERILGNHHPGRETSTSIRSMQEFVGDDRVCQVIRPLVAGGSDSQQVDVFGEEFLWQMGWRLPIIAAHNRNSPRLAYHGETRSYGDALNFLPCAGYTQWPTGFPSRFPSQWPSGFPVPSGFPSRYPKPDFGTRYPTRSPRTGFPSTGFPSTGFPERTGFPTRTGFPYRMTKFPTRYPLPALATRFPSRFPTDYPTGWPSKWPTGYPQAAYTWFPSGSPTGYPSWPTGFPSKFPTWPTGYPSRFPTWPTGYPSLGLATLPPPRTFGPLDITRGTRPPTYGIVLPSKGEKAAAALQQPAGAAQKPAQEGAAAQGEKQQAA